LSIVSTTFSEGAERNKALGIWGALGGSGGATGAFLGGFLTKYAGWEWIFFVNVPVGVAVFALAPRFVRESRLERARRQYLLLGATIFSSFFVLTLYVQDVLRYSALEAGVTFFVTGATVVPAAGAAQALVTRVGVKPILASGLALLLGAMIWYSQIPVDGSF